MSGILTGLLEAEARGQSAELVGDIPQHQAPDCAGGLFDLIAELAHGTATLAGA